MVGWGVSIDGDRGFLGVISNIVVGNGGFVSDRYGGGNVLFVVYWLDICGFFIRRDS